MWTCAGVLIEHPESVAILALDDHDQVAVVIQPRPGADCRQNCRQSREPVQGGARTVELPAGCLEPGETPAQAAVRELREECSLAAGAWRELGTFWAAPAYSTELVHVFEARDLSPSPGRPDPDEDITVEWRRASDLHQDLSDATSLAAVLLWKATAVG